MINITVKGGNCSADARTFYSWKLWTLNSNGIFSHFGIGTFTKVNKYFLHQYSIFKVRFIVPQKRTRHFHATSKETGLNDEQDSFSFHSTLHINKKKTNVHKNPLNKRLMGYINLFETISSATRACDPPTRGQLLVVSMWRLEWVSNYLVVLPLGSLFVK